MGKNARIYIAGHRGLVGSAFHRAFQRLGCSSFILRTHQELDLRDARQVEDFFAAERPQIVILAAARVGGIHANVTYPADFIYDNLTVQVNVIHQAWKHNVQRLLFLGSSCVYPRDCPQPIREEYLLSSRPEKTNEPYAIAKISGLIVCESYNRQYGTRFLSVMPTNLYGPNDNYDLQNAHVLPALLRKFHEAKAFDKPTIEIWGTGNPRREFLYSEDMAEACLFLLNQPDRILFEDSPALFNIGCGEDVTIRELAEQLRSAVGYRGRLTWNTAQPDGTPRKLLDIGRLTRLGWKPRIPLQEGIQWAYEDFLQTWTAAQAGGNGELPEPFLPAAGRHDGWSDGQYGRSFPARRPVWFEFSLVSCYFLRSRSGLIGRKSHVHRSASMQEG